MERLRRRSKGEARACGSWTAGRWIAGLPDREWQVGQRMFITQMMLSPISFL